MLKITTCTVTNHFNELLLFSIKSIVNVIDEILIFDDSISQNCYKELLKYENIKIITNDKFGKDLGKKKQHLVDISSNDIVMRWDNDFILYDVDLLNDIYIKLQNDNIDYVLTDNYNISYSFEYENKKYPFVTECYIYKKNIIKFTNFKYFLDYPVIIKNNAKKNSY